jgi:hypothetical protein
MRARSSADSRWFSSASAAAAPAACTSCGSSASAGSCAIAAIRRPCSSTVVHPGPATVSGCPPASTNRAEPGSQYASATDGSPSASASAARSSASPGACPTRAISWETASPCARRVRSRPARKPNGTVATSASLSHSSPPWGTPAASNPLASMNDANAAPPVASTGLSARRWAGPPRRQRRTMRPTAAVTTTTAAMYCMASSRSESRWSDSTINRLRGVPGCSKSRDGNWSTVTVK